MTLPLRLTPSREASQVVLPTESNLGLPLEKRTSAAAGRANLHRIDTLGSNLLELRNPVGDLFIVDHVCGAILLRKVTFLRRGSSADDCGTNVLQNLAEEETPPTGCRVYQDCITLLDFI